MRFRVVFRAPDESADFGRFRCSSRELLRLWRFPFEIFAFPAGLLNGRFGFMPVFGCSCRRRSVFGRFRVRTHSRHGFWAVFGPLLGNFSRSSNVAVRKLPVFDRILERPSWFHPGFGVVQSARAFDVPFGGVFGPDFQRFRFPTRELLRSSTVRVRGFSVFGRILDRPSSLPAVWGWAPPVMCRFEQFSQIFGAWAPEIASF